MNSTQLTVLIRWEGSRATSCLDSLPPSGWAYPLATRKVRPGPRVLQSVQHGAASSGTWSCHGLCTLACPYKQLQCLRYVWTASLLDRQSLGRRTPGCSLPSCRVSSAQGAVWGAARLTSRHSQRSHIASQCCLQKLLWKETRRVSFWQ